MAHLLLIDVPGGNDFTVLEDALALGHQVSFFTSDLDHYRRQGGAVTDLLARTRVAVEIPGFSYEGFERQVLALHKALPFAAVLCLIDIRIIEASCIARALDLPFLAPAVARLLRDKVRVREALARHGVRQPRFALASDAASLRSAVNTVGYPALLKPADGYASQDVQLLESAIDLERVAESFGEALRTPLDYGLGVHGARRWSVEQYVRGTLIGCDILLTREARIFLGINDKRMLAPPSFAMRGSCFPSQRHDVAAIRDYADAILDAVGLDFGATHIEMLVAEDGPWLVEINPRLVSAQIPFQLGYAFGRSIYPALIDLHLGQDLAEWRTIVPEQFCAIRWLVADRPGVIERIELPQDGLPGVCRVVVFRKPGDPVRPPLHNGDRLAYVMATGASQEQAETRAEAFLQVTRLLLR